MVPPWLPRPPAGFDPRKGQLTPNVPKGWQDDGTTLTAPNGYKVKLGFRKHILANNWDAGNIPLQEEVGLSPVEESNPALGAGTQQIFNSTTLEWTPTRGVFVAWTGPELLKVRADKAALQAELARLGGEIDRQPECIRPSLRSSLLLFNKQMIKERGKYGNNAHPDGVTTEA